MHRAKGQREGNVTARIFHFASREGDVVPGVGGKDRAHLGDTKSHEQTEGARGGRNRRNQAAQKIRAGLNGLRVLHGPQVREIGVHGGGVAAHENAQNDQAHQSQRLRRGENILNPFAQAQARVYSAAVRNRISRSATNCCQERLRAYFAESADGRDDPGGRRNGGARARRESAQTPRPPRQWCPSG